MPFNISFRKGGGVAARFDGNVTGAEIIAVGEIIYATEQRTRDIAYQLVDFGAVESFDVSSDDVRFISHQDAIAAEVNSHMLVAIVAAQDKAFGMSRMWQAYTDEIPLKSKVFRTLAEAEAWLQQHSRDTG